MKKNSIFLYMPAILVILYIATTLIFFLTGTVHWSTPNKGITALFLFFICVFFAGGFYFTAKKRIQKTPSKTFEIKMPVIRKMILIFSIVGVVYYIGYIINMFGEYTLRIFKYPGAIYDYKTYVILYLKQVGPFEKSFVYSIISTVHGLLIGFVAMTIPVGLYFWRSLKYEKIAVVLLIITYIIRAYYTGLQSLFLFFCVMILCVVLAKTYFKITDNKEHKNYKLYLRLVAVICALLLFFASVMYIFQRDRDNQSDLMEAHGNAYQEITGKKPNLMFWLGESINDRIDGKLAEYDFDFLLKEYDLSFTVMKAEDALFAGGLADFYSLDIDNSLLYKISPKVYYAVQSSELYFSQGYAALGLIFDLDFEWTYFLGSSKYLSMKFDSIFGTSIYEKTYIYRNEQEFGWSSSTYWSTIYSWLASDFTFFGVIIVFGVLGMLFAMTWVDLLIRKNPFALGLFCILFMGLLMTSANNFWMTDRTMLIFTGELFIGYIASLFFQKKNMLEE
ncbi:MAG: hypothetical protein AB1Z23_09775 [Eubacteriales bacterium]